MIDVADVIAYLDTNTSYVVEQGTDIIPDIESASTTPIIRVGYTTITNKNPNDTLEYDVVNTNGEDLVQGFEIHIVCDPAVFRSTWITIYKLMIDWVPYPVDQVHSRFTYKNGGRMGRNVRIWHLDNWNVAFPTNIVLI
jgi:hypothetical protein